MTHAVSQQGSPTPGDASDVTDSRTQNTPAVDGEGPTQEREHAPEHASSAYDSAGAERPDDLRWHRFLLEGERIIRKGPVHKRKGLFSRKRFLILTDMPRLIYIDPDIMVQKGVIPWSVREPVRPHRKSASTFDVITVRLTPTSISINIAAS
jgi:3-phosphoinositide dependent protein kinase-1